MKLGRLTQVGVVSLALTAFALGSTLAAPQSPAPKHPKVKITATKANKTALTKCPGKVVGKTPLEKEDGKWQYAVTVKSGKQLHEVMVDANTGAIVQVEAVTPAEEAQEAKADAAKAKGHSTKPAAHKHANK